MKITIRKSFPFRSSQAFLKSATLMTSTTKIQPNGFPSTQKTQVLSVDPKKIFKSVSPSKGAASFPDDWDFELDEESTDNLHLQRAADHLRQSDVPVAFPTETVYGLGADATRSEAVRGIYKAKQRPADNPLIVHFCSLDQLKQILRPSNQDEEDVSKDSLPEPIPEIYKPLIQKFWPGPLTILLPNPEMSRLAPEVTAGLKTFGARMPKSLLAMALIKSAGVPLAAPSANASTRPSPTAAEHVYDDLNGRIDIILDGGPCDVGVESTVVDGLSTPPSILRPGGISIEQLRQCPGWEDVVIGYKDKSEKGSTPKAPGMKYRHYSPKAKVVLYNANHLRPSLQEIIDRFGSEKRIGFILTKNWESFSQNNAASATQGKNAVQRFIKPINGSTQDLNDDSGFGRLMQSAASHSAVAVRHFSVPIPSHTAGVQSTWEIELGRDTESIARGLFSALRELDKHDVDCIVVEGIDEHEGATAAAIMNRLRKAAEMEVHD